MRDTACVRHAFEGVDVAVHREFRITGASSCAAARSINVDGTLNVLECGGQLAVRLRLVGRPYGFHRDDNPVGMTEQWPPDPRPLRPERTSP